MPSESVIHSAKALDVLVVLLKYANNILYKN